MKIVQRYLTVEVIRSAMFVLLAFLVFFSIFDLPGELQDVGRGNYRLQHAFLYVLLGMPNNAYLLMPIAVLIGAIYTLAQLAANSEFAIVRMSGVSSVMMGKMLAQIGFMFAVLTFISGELIAPIATHQAEKMKMQAQGASISQEFRSGLWTKDVIRQYGINGPAIGSRFLNAKEISPDGRLQEIRLYEFDQNFRLSSLLFAKQGDYQGANVWRLSDVSETLFRNAADPEMPMVFTTKMTQKEIVSEITPEMLSVLFVDPEKMSTTHLRSYIAHLEENHQDAGRYHIAFWKKIVYPFSIFVMMALALPFAYLHVRSGGVSFKIFSGIMIGVGFVLLNNLFSHVGLLNTWPPFITAATPSVLFLLMAMAALRWVERH